MSLYLVDLPLSLIRLYAWAGRREIGRKNLFDEGLALHHLLSEIFGPAVLQPFRLMIAPRAVQGTLYAYTGRTTDALRETAVGVAGAAEVEALPIDNLRSIPRSPEFWKEGMRLGFDLRARPVVRLASPLESDKGKFAKGTELDVFLAKTLRNDHLRGREEVYLDWLAARLAPAADLERDRTHFHSFRRLRSVRHGKRVEGPDAVFHGTLTVRDPQAFAALLARGIGRHRAYGYGMLLLRAPQRKR